MSFMDYFRSGKKPAGGSASAAKERLQIIVAHQRQGQASLEYLPRLQQELLEVIRKYVQIEEDQVQVDVDKNGDCSVLELNVTLPEGGEIKAKVEPEPSGTKPQKGRKHGR